MPLKSLWFVYLMAAPAADGLTYFKAGRTKDVLKRISGVQTGCPLRIAKVWSLGMRDSGECQRIEKMMHGLLAPFHSHGEWFRMQTNIPDHKEAMATAMKAALDRASLLTPASWEPIDVAAVRLAIKQERQNAIATRTNLRIASMVRYGKDSMPWGY